MEWRSGRSSHDPHGIVGGVGIGRKGLLGMARQAAVLLLLGSALVGRAGGQTPAPVVEAVVIPRKVPFIAGVWEFTYTYNEMRGPADNQIQNPCLGPFPYRYTWEVHIYQQVEEDVNGSPPPAPPRRKRAPSSHALLYPPPPPVSPPVPASRERAG